MSNIAIEHGPVEIVVLPIENGGSFHSSFFVCLPEGRWKKTLFTKHGINLGAFALLMGRMAVAVAGKSPKPCQGPPTRTGGMVVLLVPQCAVAD